MKSLPTGFTHKSKKGFYKWGVSLVGWLVGCDSLLYADLIRQSNIDSKQDCDYDYSQKNNLKI